MDLVREFWTVSWTTAPAYCQLFYSTASSKFLGHYFSLLFIVSLILSGLHLYEQFSFSDQTFSKLLQFSFKIV
jgi:hypothetical protein